MIKPKRAAMEMSVGTIVTIVLLMAVLVLGIFLIQKIFLTGTNAIDEIDSKIQGEIDKLFADEGKKVVVYPKEREISIKKGDSGGFGFSIMNRDMSDGIFSYVVSVGEVGAECQLTETQADNLIILGKSDDSINLGSGDKLTDAVLVKFSIPDSAPLCLIRYNIDAKKDGEMYATTSVDLKIE